MAKDKLIAAMPLILLGVDVSLTSYGASFVPDAAKREKWMQRIRQYLEAGKLTPGEASKLSGFLQWATQKTFKKLGRAMIRAIFKQASGRSSCIGKELELALRWWLQVLELGIAEEHNFERATSEVVHLFSDARSTPPRIAAVIYM